MAATPGFFIIDGWVSRAVLYVNGLQIPNFPTQTDMINGRLWIRPGDQADVVNPARLVNNPVGQRFAYGGLTFMWPMVNMSPNMVKYVQETYFSPAGAPSSFFQRSWSNQLTVQTFNRASGDWETYHVYGRFTDFAAEAELAAGGYNNMQIQFTAIKEAPLGPDVEISTAYSPPYYEFIEDIVTATMTNSGDSDTFQNTTLTWDVPSTVDFVSADNSNYPSSTIQYSDDNGVSYSSTPPGDLTTVTNVRIILGTELATGANTGAFTFTFTPQGGETEFTSTFTVATDGDQEASNNTDTDVLTINPFTPAALSPLVWFDAGVDVYEDGGTSLLATDGNPVDEWRGQGSAGMVFDQSTPANEPTYESPSLNGEPGVIFDGALGYMLDAVGPGTTSLGNNTFFVVLNPTNAGGPNPGFEIIFKSGDTATSPIWAHKINVGLEDETGWQTDDGSDFAFDDIAQAGAQLLTVVARTNGNYELYRDGSLVDTESIGLASGELKLQNAPASLGADELGGNLFQGVLYEIILFNSVLDSTDRDIITDYLTTKYGL